MSRRLLLIAVVASLTWGCARPSLIPTATPSLEVLDEAPPDEDVTEIARRYRLASADSSIDTGGAVILVKAPIDKVLKVVRDYRKYRQILPRLDQSRIVDKSERATDVYRRAPILKGMISLWAIVRFAPPEPYKGQGKKISGRMIKGNLEIWQGVWKLEPVGKDQTILRIEMLIDVKLPVPDEWVTPELMWAADKGVTAVRDMAEKGESTVKDD